MRDELIPKATKNIEDLVDKQNGKGENDSSIDEPNFKDEEA